MRWGLTYRRRYRPWHVPEFAGVPIYRGTTSEIRARLWVARLHRLGIVADVRWGY